MASNVGIARRPRFDDNGDRCIRTIARELDLIETALRAWVRQAEIDAGRGRAGALTTDEREEELAPLRRDVKRLQMERDIQKGATVFFAKEQGRSSPSSCSRRPISPCGACARSWA